MINSSNNIFKNSRFNLPMTSDFFGDAINLFNKVTENIRPSLVEIKLPTRLPWIHGDIKSFTIIMLD